MKKILNWIKNNWIQCWLICINIFFVICLCNVIIDFRNHNAKTSYISTIDDEIHQLRYYSAKNDLVLAVDSYINTVAPNSAVNGIAIVDACVEYNIDIKFVLAQAHVESHFGTTGIAAKTNSIFNVKAYDGRSANDMIKYGHGFKHPDHSIKPYMELLKNRYLTNNRTEKDLLVDYVDVDGQRHASSKNYEKKLIETINKIDSIVDITKYYQIFHKYQIIAEL